MASSITKSVKHLARLFLPIPMAVPVDMSGRHVIVTGASPGSLGYETARILAEWGATVVATRVRDVALMESSLKYDLRKSGADENNITAHPLDVCDPNSVNAFADWFRDKHQDKLHVLVNNAGIFKKTLALRKQAPLSRDGHEIHWRTNYLGAFHLTCVLLPLLRQSGLESGDARIVNVSSGLHDRGRNESLFSNRSRYRPWAAYGLSKLAMIHMAFEIDRRYAETNNLHGVAVHPGSVSTNLTFPEALRGRMGKALTRISSALASLVLLSPNAGAQTIVMCASKRPIIGGRYYERCTVAEPSVDCHDAGVSRRLWDLSEQWVGTLPKTGGDGQGQLA